MSSVVSQQNGIVASQEGHGAADEQQVWGNVHYKINYNNIFSKASNFGPLSNRCLPDCSCFG